MVFWKRSKNRGETEPQELRELRRDYDELMNILARVIDAKDIYTSGHTERVIQYCLAIGKQLRLDHKQTEELRMTALLHDIGKVGIPDHILRKPGKLTREEWDEVRKHPETGEYILQGSEGLEDVRQAVRCHQERFDGKGFPDGLKGRNIPLYARIVAIADSYDAMTSDRSYRPALPRHEALREIERCAGSQFDARLVMAFLEVTGYKRAPSPGTGAATLLAQISIRSYEAEARRLQETGPAMEDEQLEQKLREAFPMLDSRGAWKVIDAVERPSALIDDMESENTVKVKEDEYKLRLQERIPFSVGEIVTFQEQNYNLINVTELPTGSYEYHLKR